MPTSKRLLADHSAVNKYHVTDAKFEPRDDPPATRAARPQSEVVCPAFPASSTLFLPSSCLCTFIARRMPAIPTVTIQDVGAPTPITSDVALEAFTYDYIVIGGGVFCLSLSLEMMDNSD